MRIRLAISLLFLFFLVGNGRGQQQEHNGYWWVGSPDNFKLGFVSGYAMAMTAIFDRNSLICLEKKEPEAIQDCTRYEVAPFDYTKIRLGQLSEGVDDFYKDFRNKGLDINFAMIYVRDELRDKPAKELEEELNRSRNPPAH